MTFKEKRFPYEKMTDDEIFIKADVFVGLFEFVSDYMVYVDDAKGLLAVYNRVSKIKRKRIREKKQKEILVQMGNMLYNTK